MTAVLDTLEDGPLGNLPLSGSPVLLDAPDIDLVALEVRWTQPVRSIEPSDALKIRDVIEDGAQDVRLPIIEAVEQRSVTVNFGANTAPPAEEISERGHQLRNADQSITIAILPNALGIQISHYRRWSQSARPLLEAALGAAIPLLEPSLVARIGLRYVNRIEDDSCTQPTDWIGKIAPALLAPYRDWGLQRWVRNASQGIELAIDDNHSAVLRHGVLYQRTGQASDYLLDIDVFSQRARDPDTASLVRSFTRMNRTSLAIFQQSIDSDYLVSRTKEGKPA